MKSRQTVIFCTLLIAGIAQADSGIPWVGWIARPTADEVSIVVVPDGSGNPLASAQTFGGGQVDATITIRLIDVGGVQVVNFPFEDIWLDSESTTDRGCRWWGFPADRNTDANGETEFALPLAGGGWTTGPVWVYLNGSRATHPQDGELPPVAMRFNSPDLDANGSVDMSDVVIFAGDYHGEYHYRSDFIWDGVIDLSDVVVMAAALGRGCQ